jgi:hypothetical protein
MIVPRHQRWFVDRFGRGWTDSGYTPSLEEALEWIYDIRGPGIKECAQAIRLQNGAHSKALACDANLAPLQRAQSDVVTANFLGLRGDQIEAQIETLLEQRKDWLVQVRKTDGALRRFGLDKESFGAGVGQKRKESVGSTRVVLIDVNPSTSSHHALRSPGRKEVVKRNLLDILLGR